VTSAIMTMTGSRGALHAAREDLLTRLLGQYESSVSFGRPAPWPREMIVKFTDKAFPLAFSPDGADAREAVIAAARSLAAEGALRVVPIKGRTAADPAEFRLGAAEVDAAYAAAQAYGFRPLRDALQALSDTARALHDAPVRPGTPEPPEWLALELAFLAAGGVERALTSFGIADRTRVKHEGREWCDAVRAAAALAPGVDAWERHLSERLFGDTKRLAALRARVVTILRAWDPRWRGVEMDGAEATGEGGAALAPGGSDLLEHYGLRRRPPMLVCAGGLAFGRPTPAATADDVAAAVERPYALADFAPVATLPEGLALALAAAAAGDRTLRTITTIENEYAFLAYVEQEGGPAALGARGELAIYTGGFPAPLVMRVLGNIADGRREWPRAPVAFQHWGDADVGGIRIWWMLRTRLAHPVRLLRTTAAWVEASATTHIARPLTPTERRALAGLRDDVAERHEEFKVQWLMQQMSHRHRTADRAGMYDPQDHEEVLALIDALLAHGVRLEQERY
jgi:hypothetical protein